MFETTLDAPDAFRASAVAQKVRAHGFPMALTGGLAVEAQLRAHGRRSVRRPLNDLDLVVDRFATIPPSIVNDFLVHHVHPLAAQGKMALQLVDAERAVRVDMFTACGQTLSRTSRLKEDTDPLDVIAVEDLVARTTAHVCATLGRNRRLDTKHLSAFRRLSGLGEPERLEEAWQDHREALQMSLDDAIHEAARLIEFHPELVVDEPYSHAITPCEQCLDYGAFRRSDPEWIVQILGYW